MKKIVLVGVLLVVIAGLAIGTSFAIGAVTAPAPNAIVLNPLNKMDTKVCNVTFMGSNFPAGAEVKFLIKTPNGVSSDLDSFLVPANTPVMTDSMGNFVAVFNAGTFINKKVITQGVFKFSITDADYSTLATVPVAFYDAAAPDKWPDWVKANVPAPAK